VSSLIGGVEKVEIRLVEYDPRWPSIFERHAAQIQRALAGLALRIEHVGSTSVPGLPAKPIIDIILVVTDSDDEAGYLPALECTGYELRVRAPGHRMLRTPCRDVHIHVYSAGCDEIERCLVFRDQLRNKADDRELYASVKRQLVARDWVDMNAYAAAKGPVIESILARGKDGVT
jgi:GrpB-like predicted nucleotidyltransferase (UPF0157 family)